jgi:hypothetical protein
VADVTSCFLVQGKRKNARKLAGENVPNVRDLGFHAFGIRHQGGPTGLVRGMKGNTLVKASKVL